MRSSSSFGCPDGDRSSGGSNATGLNGVCPVAVAARYSSQTGLHQVGQLAAQQPILDDRDPPRLAVAAARREPGVVEDRGDGGAVDRLVGEASRRAGGPQGGDEIHRVDASLDGSIATRPPPPCGGRC